LMLRLASAIASCMLVALLGAPLAAAAQPGGVVHVERAGGRIYIADADGRELLLRGTAVNGLIQYNDDFREEVPVASDDFHEMAALGYTYLRLPISWSRLEPAPGAFDSGYLDQITATVQSAEASRLGVVIDFHQDRYNRHTWPGQEVDGAPDWATETDGAPCTDFGVSTLCAQVATHHFWSNDVVAGKPLQQHYLDALLAISRRLRSDTSLVGIELMNEPSPGFVLPPAFELLELHPFYARMIAGLRADGERRTIWFEPNILRDVSDVDSGVARPFSSDRNLVYAPHIYTEVFSAPRSITPFSRQHQQASFEAAAREAQLYDAPLVDGEWGGGAGGDWERYRAEHLDLEDQYLAGFGFWMWKQQPGFYDWHTVKVDGGLRSDCVKAQQLSRPHPDAVPGHLVSISWSNGRLNTSIDGPGGTVTLWSGTVVRRGGPTLINRPLTRVLVDGHERAAQLEAVEYSSPAVDLFGYRVRVLVAGGSHTIVLADPLARAGATGTLTGRGLPGTSAGPDEFAPGPVLMTIVFAALAAARRRRRCRRILIAGHVVKNRVVPYAIPTSALGNSGSGSGSAPCLCGLPGCRNLLLGANSVSEIQAPGGRVQVRAAPGRGLFPEPPSRTGSLQDGEWHRGLPQGGARW
jgi:hypothetical protein